MEVLQAFTYSVIDACGTPANQVATLLGFLHIAIQPFFINALSLHFIPEEARRRVEGPVRLACLVALVLMIIKIYPFEWAQTLPRGHALCAERLCSVSGDWHIAWDLPVNDLLTFSLFDVPIIWAPYIVSAFVLPLLYGSWRFTLYHLLLGPLLARATTSNPNEYPAVWCLLSIGFLLIVIETPVRKWLYVRRVWWHAGTN
jgi:hypothetical protein